jgi:hypothetical protein
VDEQINRSEAYNNECVEQKVQQDVKIKEQKDGITKG